LKEPDRSRTGPDSNHGEGAEHNRKKHEREPLGWRVEMLEQRQLNEEAARANEDE
jgi:hypothetical protein